MKSYLALVEPGDEHHAFGIRFPDLPGVFSAADSKDDIIANAIEALRLWAEDEELPEPSDAAAITQRSDVKEDLRNGWYLIDVPLIESDPKVVRANITLERGVLDAIDTTAKRLGMTRSAFLSSAAKSKIERNSRPLLTTSVTHKIYPVAFANVPRAAAKAAAKPAAKVKASAKKTAAKVAPNQATKVAAKPAAKSSGQKPK
jgi:predicted RNase H-like HicB family nuclease